MIEKDFKKIGTRTLKSAGITEVPVDLERLCAYLRLHHERPWHLPGDVWDALARPSRGRTRFKSQESRASARSRWRLAHEIAHHLIHGANPNLRAGTWETHEVEYEADLLAAELLMPEASVKKALKAHDDGLDLDELAASFGVGPREMEKRLRELALLPAEHHFRG